MRMLCPCLSQRAQTTSIKRKTFAHLQKHRERSLAAHAYSVTALTVSILEETLAQLETLCQPNFAQDQNDKPDFVIAKAQSHHLGTASTCARDFLHVPGVHSVAFDGDDDNMV